MSKNSLIRIFFFTIIFAFISCTLDDFEKENSSITAPHSSITNSHEMVSVDSEGAITVFGQNDASVDPNNVQNAVDTFDVVLLKGTFDFGIEGHVLIDRPGVSLQGPATINNGGGYIGVIIINSPGVKVRGLTINTPVYGANGIAVLSIPLGPDYISPEVTGEEIIIEGNDITSSGWDGWGIYMHYRGGYSVTIRNNSILGTCAIFDGFTGYTRDENRIIAKPVDESGQHILAPLNIVNNRMTIRGRDGLYYDGLRLWGWPVGVAGLWNVPADILPLDRPAPPDWGENGPIEVTGNIIHCDSSWAAIVIGRSAHGLNNCTVSNNTITGFAIEGISAYPYGHDKVISGNDLSGLTTMFESILVNAPNTTVTNNILGKSQNFVPLGFYSINWHPNTFANLPMPLPTENCIIMDNDYRETDQPGWKNGFGCIIVASEQDMQMWSGVGTEVMNNTIIESGRFPRGTGGASKQILELIGENGLVYDNRIIGLPANNLSPPKGLGNMIRELKQQRMKYQKNSEKKLSKFE